MESVDLKGKVTIVTGSNCGIGKETAADFARRGARVILACRNRERAHQAREEIVKETGNVDVVVKILNLASLRSVREFAADFNQSEDRLDILVNNAGLFVKTREETEDGIEMTMGTNHFGHFLLTNLLLEKLKASAPSRIVVVSSMACEQGYAKIDLDDINQKRNFSSGKAYGYSKAANVMFAYKLAELLEGTGVTTYSLHPGFVKTEIFREIGKCQMCCIIVLFRCFCMKYIECDEGARTTLYCALHPDLAGESGHYYSDCRQRTPPSHLMDKARVDRLWDLSAELTNWTGSS